MSHTAAPITRTQATDYLQARHVKAAGERAVKRFNETSIFSVCRKSDLTQEQIKEQQAADQAIKSFEEKGTKTVRLMKTSEGRDRPVKVALALTGVLNHFLAHAPDVSSTTREGFDKFEKSMKGARTIFAIMNIFGGVLQGIVNTFKAIIELLTCLIKGDVELESGTFSIDLEKREYRVVHRDGTSIEYPVSDDDYYVNDSGQRVSVDLSSFPKQGILEPDDVQHVDQSRVEKAPFLYKRVILKRQVSAIGTTLKDKSVYRGRAEQAAGLLAMLGQLGGSTAYTVGFGLCSPIKCVDSHWKLGKSANAIGNQFPFVMMINHVAELGHTIGDFVHEGMVYRKSKEGDESAFRRFWQSMGKLIVFACEKLCELGSDLFTVFKVQGPPLAKLLLTFIASCISLGRLLNESQIGAEREIRKNAEEAEKAARFKLVKA
jgi:hypothetical protein